MNLDVKLLTVLRKLNMSFIDTLGKDLNNKGLTTSEYAVLVYLNEIEKATIQELAKIAFITSGTATHLINKLISAGNVIKEQDQDDKRIYWIKITKAGEKKLKKVNMSHLKFLENLLKNFTDEEKKNFIEQIKYFGKTIAKSKRSQQ